MNIDNLHFCLKSKNLFSLISKIYEKPNITPTELCELLKFDPSYLSQLLRKIDNFLLKTLQTNFQYRRISLTLKPEFVEIFKPIIEFVKNYEGMIICQKNPI